MNPSTFPLMMMLTKVMLFMALALSIFISSSNAQVEWVNVPKENLTDPIMVDVSVSGGGLEGAKNFALSMINTAQSKPINLDFINAQMEHQRDHGSVDNSAVQSEAVAFFTPIIVVVGLGFVCALIVPFVGCCFGCCRCCGKCGAKRMQKDHTNRCRLILIIVLAISLAFIFSGMVVAFYANKRFSDSIGVANAAGQSAVDNFNIFINNTLVEGDNLFYTNVPLYKDEILFILSEFSASFVQDLIDEFEDDLAELRDKTIDFETLIISVRDGFGDLAVAFEDIETNVIAANNALVNIKANLDEIYANCAPDCPPPYVVPDSLQYDTTLIPDFNTYFTSLSTIIDSVDIATLAQEGYDFFMDLTVTMQNEISDYQQEIEDSVDEFYTEALEHYEDAMTTARDAQNSLNSDSVKSSIQDAHDSAEPYDKYRYQGGLALCVMVLIFFVLGFVGLVLGVISNDRNALPCDRSSKSNAAGNLLMAGVFFAFFFIFWIFLFAAFSFLFASLGHKLCDPIMDGSLYDKVVDNPDNFDGEYPLSKMIGYSHVLRVNDVLAACDANEALFNALRLDLKINVTDLTDFEREIDFEDLFDNLISLNTSDIFSNAIVDFFNSFTSLGIDDIDFDAIDVQLTIPLFDAGFDWSDFQSDMVDYCNLHSSLQCDDILDDINLINDRINDINNLRNNAVPLLDNFKVLAQESTTDSAEILALQSNLLQAIADFFDDLVDNDLRTLLESLLDVARSFRDTAVVQLTTVMGGCKPLKQAYDNVLGAACIHMLNTLDAFMFSMGLIAAFSIPFIISSVKLAKYFRRMDARYYLETPMRDDYDIGMTSMGRDDSSPTFANDYNAAASDDKPPAYY